MQTEVPTWAANRKFLMKLLKYILAGFLLSSILGNAQFNEKPILNLQNEDMAFLNWGYLISMILNLITKTISGISW